MHLKEQLRRFEEELSNAKPQEREPMVRAMTQVLLSLKREHEQMLDTINTALNNLNAVPRGEQKEGQKGGRLMDKINQLILHKEEIENDNNDNESGSTIAYLKKYNLLQPTATATAVTSPKNASPNARIFSSPVSKIL